MFFGFSNHQEFIPELYKNYTRKKLNLIFLHQYNANVEDDLKISFEYANKAKNLRDIFKLILTDLLCVNFGKVRKICIQSNVYIQNFNFKESKIFKTRFENFIRVKKLLRTYFCGVCFNTQDLFIGYVYDKISKQNPNKSVILKDNLIVVEQKLALLVCSKKINIKELQNCLENCNEIQKALNLICKNSFSNFYIIYPKNDNFNHFVEIKHFLCDLNKTMLKLVPYSISNKLIRRI